MTPTREQVIEWAEEAGAIQLHEEGWGPVIQGSIGDMQRFAVLAMERAHAAGLEQGLREAGTACETQSLNKMHADLKSIARKHWRAFHETSHAKWQGMAMAYEQAAIKCKRAAAAIEQLRASGSAATPG